MLRVAEEGGLERENGVGLGSRCPHLELGPGSGRRIVGLVHLLLLVNWLGEKVAAVSNMNRCILELGPGLRYRGIVSWRYLPVYMGRKDLLWGIWATVALLGVRGRKGARHKAETRNCLLAL